MKSSSGALGLTSLGLSKDGALDLLVMENCFYDRQISRIYDLKGSERNRFNAEAAANPQVRAGRAGGRGISRAGSATASTQRRRQTRR